MSYCDNNPCKRYMDKNILGCCMISLHLLLIDGEEGHILNNMYIETLFVGFYIFLCFNLFLIFISSLTSVLLIVIFTIISIFL